MNLAAITSVSFVNDGRRLLAGNSRGVVNCWDVSNLGASHELLATIRASDHGIVSLSCKR